MPEETLLTAARRAVRDFNIDMNKGALMTRDTERSMLTLDNQVALASAKIKTEGSVTITEDYGEKS